MGKKVVVYCDNEASVTVLNTGFSRDMFMQSCLREICYLAAVHGFEGRSRHINQLLLRLESFGGVRN
jgi:hypothetical protein